MIMLVEVRLGVQCAQTGVIRTGSATAGIRAGKYTHDDTTNLRKILNKRCAQQKCLQKCVGLVKGCAQTVKPQGDDLWVL